MSHRGVLRMAYKEWDPDLLVLSLDASGRMRARNKKHNSRVLAGIAAGQVITFRARGTQTDQDSQLQTIRNAAIGAQT